MNHKIKQFDIFIDSVQTKANYHKYEKYKAKYLALKGGSGDRQIFFVRHGETEWNKLDKSQGGDIDIPLNDTGRNQSKLTGEYLKKYGPFDIIYSSPLIRAKETAEIIAKEIGYHDKIIEINGFKENMNGDKITGKTNDDPIIKEMNDEMMSYFTNDPIENTRIFPEVMKKLSDKYGFEDPVEFTKRIRTAFDDIMKGDFKKIMIVAHGGVIEGLLEDIFKVIEIARGNMKAGSNCYISVIQWNKENGYRMISAPNTMHLEIEK